MPISLTPSNVEPLIKKLHEVYLPIASQKGVRLELDIQGRLPEAMLDPKLMERALSNLLTNAFKFTPAGGTVAIAAKSADDAVFVTVSDTGRGIPEGEQARVFDMYYRASGSGGAEGTGLGLSIVKAVAEAHGGSVSVKSSPGEGSAFTMRVPCKAAKADGPGA
jgi:signal transduction histidine kinase